MGKRHECRYWRPGPGGHRGHRWCDYCGREEVLVNRGDGPAWERVMTAAQFGHKWATPGGTTPEPCFTIEVAYPFEWNCYESFNVVFRRRGAVGRMAVRLVPVPQPHRRRCRATIARMSTLTIEIRGGEGGDDAALFARQLTGALGR